jgi:microcystin-dependent protein
MKYLLVVIAAWFGLCDYAFAQVNPFLGQVMIFAGNFCPKYFAPTDGTLMSINANVALYSVIGTTYGGDGQSTFALPNTQPILTKSGPPLTQCIAVQGAYPERPQ